MIAMTLKARPSERFGGFRKCLISSVHFSETQIWRISLDYDVVEYPLSTNVISD